MSPLNIFLNIIVFSLVAFILWQKREIIINKIREEKEYSNKVNQGYKEARLAYARLAGRKKAEEEFKSGRFGGLQ